MSDKAQEMSRTGRLLADYRYLRASHVVIASGSPNAVEKAQSALDETSPSDEWSDYLNAREQLVERLAEALRETLCKIEAAQMTLTLSDLGGPIYVRNQELLETARVPLAALLTELDSVKEEGR